MKVFACLLAFVGFSAAHVVSYSSQGSHGGYSSGSSLRTLAQDSAKQAHSAVASQHSVAKQAAYAAKSTLAQAASQAAATAEAALEGKQALVEDLQHQAYEASESLRKEIDQLVQAQISAQALEELSQLAKQEILTFQNFSGSAVNSSNEVIANADKAVADAITEAASQTAMVQAAQEHLHFIKHKLHTALAGLQATQNAAGEAAAFAQAAQHNAALAGDKANEAAAQVSKVAAHVSPAASSGFSSNEPYIIGWN